MVSIPKLQAVVLDQTEILSLLRTVFRRSTGESYHGIARLIADSPAPLEARRACALAIVADAGSIPPAVLRNLLTDPASLAKLREMVRTSESAEDFHFGAAKLLAHFGDREVLPDLAAWRPKLVERSPNFGEVIDGLIWTINVQNPPHNLLRFIASAERGGRMWAIDRALELGFSKTELREAIVQYAHEFPLGKERQVRLGGLKKYCVKEGILTDDDWPDVTYLKIPTSNEPPTWPTGKNDK
jgi:hypothetical protein